MAKNTVDDWDTTAANNTDIAGIPVSNSTQIVQLDNIVQQLMAQVKAFFASALFRLRDSTDQTKKAAFDLSGITTATTRTLVVPDRSGAIAVPTSPAEQATTSGTSIDFTGIPAGTKQITVSLYKVSTVAGAQMVVQLGDSGGVETSGYEATGTQSFASGSAVGTTSYTAGFGIRVSSSANATVSGSLILTRVHATDNVWCAAGNFADFANEGFGATAGTKLLSATLDRIRLTTVGGTDTFDAGAINIMYA